MSSEICCVVCLFLMNLNFIEFKVPVYLLFHEKTFENEAIGTGANGQHFSCGVFTLFPPKGPPQLKKAKAIQFSQCSHILFSFSTFFEI